MNRRQAIKSALQAVAAVAVACVLPEQTDSFPRGASGSPQPWSIRYDALTPDQALVLDAWFKESYQKNSNIRQVIMADIQHGGL